ncbi:ethylene-responsive transcription factor ERF015 [Malania oleifera]|uniref:ethylene-responsive transcription factor ERF015 n=1 Tax=Malania oleifera TaxID=397392 RepID=UPI0025AE2AEE|nr:ethylene-responsive transcription factor ERF015 [Malania oleifera]
MDSAPTAPPRKIRQKRNPGPYKGVRMRSMGRWVSEIRIPKTKTRIWLGSYDAPEKAARAYDAALYCVRGVRGLFNFPADKKPELPDALVGSLSKNAIKAIAESFASLNALVPPPISTPMTAPMPSNISVLPDTTVLSEMDVACQAMDDLLATPSAPAMATILPESLQLDDLILDVDLMKEFIH